MRGKDLQLDFMADACFQRACIRATIDTFWSRSKKTGSDHRCEVRFMTRYGKALGFETLSPLGPFSLGQHSGMLQAILLKMRLTEKGHKGKTCMFGTARMI